MTIFRDTVFGKIVRKVSGGKVFPYEDTYDSELRQRYIDEGTVDPSDTDLKDVNTEEIHIIGFLDDDPDDPRNWTLGKKCFVTFDVCLLTMSIYIGSAIYTSGLRDIEQQFGVSSTVATLGLTLYVLGYGCGPMIWSPLSEIPMIGRNPVYWGTLFVFVSFNFAVVYAKNIGMLLAFRFLTGFFGSPVLATGGATLSDMFSPSKRAYAFSIFGMANLLGPTIGPVVGNFAVEFKGWTWSIWELIWISGFALVFLFFFFPETSADNILYRRVVRLRQWKESQGQEESKDQRKFMCEPEIEGQNMTMKDAVSMTLVRPFSLCFTEPIVLALNLYIAFIYAILYCWLESIPIAFEEKVYGFSQGISGLCYLGITVGGLITLPPYWYYNWKYVEPRFTKEETIRPEIRLECALVGCFCLPICLFMFGWTAQTSVPFIVPVIATGFFTIGAFLSFAAVLNYLGDAYPTQFASISAGNDFLRSCFGAAFPLFATQMFNTLGLNWGNSLLGFITLIFIPMIFALYFKGNKLRKRSKLASHDF